MNLAVDAEALRQSALLAALLGAEPGPHARLAERGARRHRGLGAYRANAASIAERALVAAYPTLCALIGAEDFARLARALWQQAPPQRGDLAHWGHDLPAFIETQRDFDEWPYLADCARLDAAIRRCESAADAQLERDTLAWLAEHPSDVLRLRLLPSVQLLASAWPIAMLHVAHQREDDGGFAEVRAALAARRAESVVVARSGWRADVAVIDAPMFAWMQALQARCSLAEALQAAGGGFEFNAWLVQALQRGWLWKAELIPAPEEKEHDPDLA
ncbi:DNA-binding domain-containing protein [Methylibium sp.]|uniref:HvfC/BufC N-terminal domain-containing protein n=1 Tax=Methylibium sp. TaxID=2067992 RepID=UPI003D0E93AB